MSLDDIDRDIMQAFVGEGLDAFNAQYHADDSADPVDCSILRDTLELENEYGISTVQSGALIHYLASDVPQAAIGGWFIADGRRYVVEDRVPTQDGSWRKAHCRVEPIS